MHDTNQIGGCSDINFEDLLWKIQSSSDTMRDALCTQIHTLINQLLMFISCQKNLMNIIIFSGLMELLVGRYLVAARLPTVESILWICLTNWTMDTAWINLSMQHVLRTCKKYYLQASLNQSSLSLISPASKISQCACSSLVNSL